MRCAPVVVAVVLVVMAAVVMAAAIAELRLLIRLGWVEALFSSLGVVLGFSSLQALSANRLMSTRTMVFLFIWIFSWILVFRLPK